MNVDIKGTRLSTLRGYENSNRISHENTNSLKLVGPDSHPTIKENVGCKVIEKTHRDKLGQIS